MPLMMTAISNMPPQIQERIVCSISAAVKYQVPANIILAVAEKEAGKSGQWVRNSNGTHDVGQMQFNTAYLKELRAYSISASDVAASGCYAFDLAAWRIGYHIRHDKKGDLWTRSANYHSQTYRYNSVYRADLIRKALKWADWLDARFVTYDVTKQAAKPAILSVQQPASAVSCNTDGYVPGKVSINGRH